MTIPPYTLGFPPDGSTLGNTKATIRNNLDGTFEAFSVNHQNQNETNPGFHNTIQMNVEASPALGAASIALYAADNSGADSLWIKNAINGYDFPITGPTHAGNPGYTSLFGGILMCWGTQTVTTSPAVVNFPSGFFPNARFSVVVTPNGSNPGSFGIISYTGNTAFTVGWSGPAVTAISWIAIGN